MNSGARRLAMRSSAGPTRPPSPSTVWHLAHWTLLLGSKKSFRPTLASPVRYGFQVFPAGAAQAANEEHQLGDLVVLEGIAQLFHGRFGNAVLDRADDVRVRAAVDEFFAGQVGPLAAAAGAAVTAAAQAAEQRLALGQSVGFGLGGLGPPRSWAACTGCRK